jgi:thermitase
MKSTRLTLFSFVLVTLLLLAAPLTYAKAGDSFRLGEINVEVAAGVSITTINARYGTSVLEQIGGTNLYRLRLPAGADVLAVREQMGLDLDIVFAEPNYNYQAPETRQSSQAFVDQSSQAFVDGQKPGDFFGQAQLNRLRLAQAQFYTRGGGVRVAVVDTGLDFNHPLFAGRSAYPVYDFVGNDGNPNDELGGTASGHGTFVAGLIRLTAPQAGLMPLRAFGSDGIGTSFNIARAIRFAVDNGAQVINMSFGLLVQEYLIKDALDYAAQHNVVLVAAAGNDNASKIHFPAFRSNVLAVTATDDNDRKASFANLTARSAFLRRA